MNEQPTITVDVYCDSCGGTGLYRGMLEPEGEAVICWMCKGSGKRTREIEVFAGRKPRTDVRLVRHTKGPLSYGKLPAIPYQEFVDGNMPPLKRDWE